jgi:hypothetical protein
LVAALGFKADLTIQMPAMEIQEAFSGNDIVRVPARAARTRSYGNYA